MKRIFCFLALIYVTSENESSKLKKDGKDFLDGFLDDKIEDRGFESEEQQYNDRLWCEAVIRELKDLLAERDDWDKKRNRRDKREKVYDGTEVKEEKERNFKDGKDFLDGFLDDKIEDRGFDSEDEDMLCEAVLRELKDLMAERDDREMEKEHGGQEKEGLP
eukprot:XP_011415683.1 PREDICTED: uncharacterized protein LOC105319450 [Crassostrea gigas]